MKASARAWLRRGEDLGHAQGIARSLALDEVEGDLVPVARRRHGAAAVGPELGDPLLLRL
jgi:hypothetical protein